MFFIPTAMLLDAVINLYQFLALNLLLATLGNIVGGAVFVA
jgi:formate/nitrite transporter FocA (FNT family)